jgi:hypothetical protein
MKRIGRRQRLLAHLLYAQRLGGEDWPFLHPSAETKAKSTEQLRVEAKWASEEFKRQTRRGLE